MERITGRGGTAVVGSSLTPLYSRAPVTAGTRVKPPQLDEFFCTEEASLRAVDFAELGFTEEMVWGHRVVAPA